MRVPITTLFLCLLWANTRAKCDDFYDLVQRACFVDKTPFLEKFFKAYTPRPSESSGFSMYTAIKSNNYFFTLPPGFGKTSIMQMIRSFAEFEFGTNNTIKPYKETKAYQVFKGLRVSKSGTTLTDHVAQYGVIHLDLTFEPEDLTDEVKAGEALRRKLADSMRRYGEHFNRRIPARPEKYVRNLLIDNVTLAGLNRSLYCMAKSLDQFEGKGTVLLIDNFDSAARISITKDGLAIKPLYELIQSTLEKFFEICTERNPFYRRCYCLMTAATNLYFIHTQHQVSQKFLYYPFLKYSRFSGDFGFRPEETVELLKRYNCSDEEKADVERYYLGYKTDLNNIQLYNPVSVLGYLESKRNTGAGKLEPYWFRDQLTDFVVQFAEAQYFREKLKELFMMKKVRLTTSLQCTMRELFIMFLESPGRNFAQMCEDDMHELLYYFFEMGFLKHADRPWFSFSFANSEIQEGLYRNLEQQGILF